MAIDPTADDAAAAASAAAAKPGANAGASGEAETSAKAAKASEASAAVAASAKASEASSEVAASAKASEASSKVAASTKASEATAAGSTTASEVSTKASDDASGKADRAVRASDKASDDESGTADKAVRAADKASDDESGKADKAVRASDKGGRASDDESGEADKSVRAADKASDDESGKADKTVRASDKASKGAPPDTNEGLAAKLNRKKWMVFIIVGLLSLVADQATKIWARGTLPTDRIHASLSPGVAQVPCVIPDDIVSRACQGHEVGVIGKFWSWRLSMNPGSAFGLFSGQNSARIFLSIVGIAAVFGMIWMLRKARNDQRVLHWALALVAGGAIGNLIDRIYYGVVTDFVLWRYDTHEWPVFNVADIVLVVGVGLMFIDIQKEGKREKRERAEKVKAAGLVKRR